MNRRTFLKVMGLGSMVTLQASVAQAVLTPRRQPKNIVLILADDIGYGDMSCYGTTPNLTPFIDGYVKRGIQFMDAHTTASTCTPSRFAMFTGEYAWRHPGLAVAQGDAALLIDPKTMTLPKLMQASGRVTGAVGKWHLGLGLGPGKTNWNAEIAPNAKDVGFDYSFLMAATADRTPCVYVENSRVVGADPNDPIEVSYHHNYPGELDGVRDRATLKMDWDYGHNQAVVNGIGRIGYMKGGKKARWVDEDMADIFVEKANAFIEANKDKPFFLYLGTNDIHVPRVPHPRFVGSTPFGPRGDATRQFDDTVQRVIEKLQALGLEEDTLVIISSDNGPMVNDGYKDQAVEKLGNHRPTAHWRGHKYTPYEGGHRVPFIAVWPSAITPNRKCHEMISLVDMGATLAALVDVPLPAGTLPDSFDQSQLFLSAGAPSARTAVIAQNYQLNIRDKQWKYIVPRAEGDNPRGGRDPLNGELYNLDADPSETFNVVKDYPEQARKMYNAILTAVRNGHTRPNF